MSSIEIISPVGIKGLGRDPYFAKIPPDPQKPDQVYDERHYIFVGGVVIDDAGIVRDTVHVDITSDLDPDQDTTADQTGTYWNKPTGDIYRRFPAGVLYYPFSYEFRVPGDHKITFTAIVDGATVVNFFTVHAQ